MMRSFGTGLLGLLVLGFGGYTLSKALRSGAARLRGPATESGRELQRRQILA